MDAKEAMHFFCRSIARKIRCYEAEFGASVTENLKIRRATENDAARLVEIYNPFVLSSTVTFEETPVDAKEMGRRIEEKLLKHDWLVGELNENIAGFAHYGTFRPRAAYGHTVESTIYMAEGYSGRGLGRELYSALIRSAAEKRYRELIGVIALPNPASIALHERLGFQQIGLLSGVGFKLGRYVDVSLWQ